LDLQFHALIATGAEPATFTTKRLKNAKVRLKRSTHHLLEHRKVQTLRMMQMMLIMVARCIY
jgi:hypothetical protein